ncbi:hypothetical protein HY642_01320 [Candidatus Woesearchaeota archaeon]|nr:hypothetical protein [Candidatus Woesearchaeota archaeon]
MALTTVSVYRHPQEQEMYVFCFPVNGKPAFAFCDREGLPDLAFMLRCRYARMHQSVPPVDVVFDGIDAQVVQMTLLNQKPTYLGPIERFEQSHAPTRRWTKQASGSVHSESVIKAEV